MPIYICSVQAYDLLIINVIIREDDHDLLEVLKMNNDRYFDDIYIYIYICHDMCVICVD